MSGGRQGLGGLFTALFSALLVLGAVFLTYGEAGRTFAFPTGSDSSTSPVPPGLWTPTLPATLLFPSDTPFPLPSETLVLAFPTETPSATPTTGVEPERERKPTRTRAAPQATRVSCSLRSDWGYSYTVRRGDNLYSIATRAGISVNTLMQGNCLTSITIYPGQVLRVPRPVGVIATPTSPRPGATATRQSGATPTSEPPSETPPPAYTQPANTVTLEPTDPPPTNTPQPPPTNTPVPPPPTNTPVTPPPTVAPSDTPVTPPASPTP